MRGTEGDWSIRQNNNRMLIGHYMLLNHTSLNTYELTFVESVFPKGENLQTNQQNSFN